jgi:hypothetical protein
VVVNTSLTLNQFTITPDSGSVQLILPITATAFAQAQDSLGGADANFDSEDNATASASALAFLANASGLADAVGFTGTATSGINIPDIDASATSVGQGGIQGMLQITGATGPVNVSFAAALSASQFLQTNQYGISATSEVVFSFLLPDISGDNLLFYDNLLSIGPDQLINSSTSPNLTASATLQPDTPYFFIIGLDAESAGVDSVPEPATFVLAGIAACSLLLRRRNTR